MKTAHLLAAIAACSLCCASLAQDGGDKDSNDRAKDPPAGDPLPSLDDLLGVKGGSSDGEEGAELPEERTDEELERLLSGKEIADEFRAAVDLMNRSARRLGAAHDTSVRTQRMQEDVLRKLDKLIADAESRAQQSSSSSSSSSQSQKQPQSQPNQQSQQQPGGSQNQGEADPPGLQTGALRPEQAADLAAWGSLPARVRDALVQGSTDRFSATYRKLTEAYYRMLAEEADR